MDILDWTSWQNNSPRTRRRTKCNRRSSRTLPVHIVLLFARLHQRVGSLHSFTIYLCRWIIPVHTTNMDNPLPYLAIKFVIHSTLVCWSRWLLLSLWLAWQIVAMDWQLYHCANWLASRPHEWSSQTYDCPQSPPDSTHLQWTWINYYYILLHI